VIVGSKTAGRKISLEKLYVWNLHIKVAEGHLWLGAHQWVVGQ